MNHPAHKTEGVNRMKTVRVYPFVFTVEVPCKEVRTPLNSITFNEERDMETSYGYCNDYQPHAVKRMFDHKNEMLYDMRWDKAGNLGQVSMGRPGEMFEKGRFLFWTEDNRLYTVADERYYSYYAYDHTGQRTLKMTGDASSVDVNAWEQHTYGCLNHVTLYPSPYMVLTEQGYTKHYFEEGRRICSKIGGGMRGNVTEEEIDSRVPELTYNYDDQFRHQYDGIHQTFHDCIRADPQIIDGVNLHKMLIDRELRRDNDEPAFFYHGDHLGSAAYLTYHGGVIQTLNYLPYGEDWVEYNFFHPDDTTRLGIYRFNGKEKDYESGFHYFGARYYWSEVLTGWLCVDPMADKYSNISPYNYCMWNPIKLVDLNGLEASDPPKSRITVRNGYVVLKMNNLHNTTRNRINAFNNDPRNWPEGHIGAIGPLAQVEFRAPELLDPQGGYGYSQPSNHNVKTKAVKAESTGRPDQRVKPRSIASSGSKGMNFALVAIDATIFTLDAIACYLWNNDMKNINIQLDMMRSAFEDVMTYKNEVGLPQNYCTAEQMLYIANYVLQGENVTKDPVVKQIGDEIRSRVNNKYKNQIQQCQREY